MQNQTELELTRLKISELQSNLEKARVHTNIHS